MLPYLIAGAIGFGIGKLFEEGGEAGEKYVNGGGIGEYKMYKLRAEGLNDFLNFLGTGVYFNVKSFTVEPIGVPDVVVSFETNLSLSEIKAKLREVQDSHVMLETIKPIKEYTGERYAGGGETFMAGGRITTNEGIIESFLNSNREVRVGNLESVEMDDIMYLRNYRTFVAKRMGDKVKISSQKYSQTTSTITNRLKALAEKMGYSVEYVTEKEIYNFDEFEEGGETFMAGGRAGKNYYWITMDRNKIDEYIGYASRMYGMFEGQIYTQAPNKVAFDSQNDMFAFTSMIDNHNNDNDFQEGDEGYIHYEELFNGEPRPNIFDRIIGGKYTGGGKLGAISKTKIEITENEEGHKIATRTLVKENKDGEKITYELKVGVFKDRKKGYFEIYATDEEDEEYFYAEGGLWIEGGRVVDYDGVYELSEKVRPLLSALNLNSQDIYAKGGEAEKKHILRRGTPIRKNIRKKRPKTRNPKMIRTIFEEEYFKDFDNGGEAGETTRDNYDALIGRMDNRFYFLDEIFKYKDGFKGATGTIVMPVNSQYYEYATSEDGILERYMDAMGEDEWLEALQLNRDDFEDEDDLTKAIEDGIYQLYSYGELQPFEDAGSDIESQMRELSEFADESKYPLFEVIGGGRIFGKNVVFDEIYNQELYDKIKQIEEFANGGVAKKRRRSASVQYGRSNTAVDKTRPAKPVGYRFTDEKATELNKETYDIPTESEVKKYLGKGIYKENRKRHSDKDRNAKL